MLSDLHCEVSVESLAARMGPLLRSNIRFTTPALPTFPLQQGSTKAVQIAAPIFANMVVQEDTWKEKDATRDKEYRNGASITYLTAFADPGVDAVCEWVLNVGIPLFVKGQVVVPTTDTVATPRNFLIKDVDNSEYNGFVVKQSVKLCFKPTQSAGLTPS